MSGWMPPAAEDPKSRRLRDGTRKANSAEDRRSHRALQDDPGWGSRCGRPLRRQGFSDAARDAAAASEARSLWSKASFLRRLSRSGLIFASAAWIGPTLPTSPRFA